MEVYTFEDGISWIQWAFGGNKKFSIAKMLSILFVPGPLPIWLPLGHILYILNGNDNLYLLGPVRSGFYQQVVRLDENY